MKNLINYLSKFAPDNGSGMHRLWTDNGPMKSRKLFALLFCLLFVGVGSAWGAAPTLEDLVFSTENSKRIVNENFSGVSTTDQTATKAANSSLSGFGVFNKVYNNSASNHYAIESSVFSSNALKITMGSGSPCGVAISGETFGTTGAYRFRVTKTAKMYAGIYAEGATSTAYAKANASVYIQANAGTISISKNTSSGNWQSVGSYTSNTYIDICVIYNNTNLGTTYGNSISLASKSAHVYIDGTCVMNGENPKSFTISGLTLSTFRVYPIASNGNVASIDDLQIWNELPSAAASCTPPGTALSLGASSTTIYKDGTSTLAPSGGNGSTITYSVTSANSTYASIVGTTFSATLPGTYTIQASQDADDGVCGGTATVNITVRYQIKWSVNGDDTYEEGDPTTYIAEHNGTIGTFPTSPAKSACDGSKEFVGWTATPIVGTTDSKPTFVSPQTGITDNTTLYAVFATRTANSYSLGDIDDLVNGKNVIVYNANQSKAMASSIQTTGKLDALGVTFSSTNITSPDASLIWTVYNSGTKYIFKNSSNNYLRVTSSSSNTNLTCDGTSDTWTITEVSTGVYSLYSTAGSSTYPLEAYYSSPNYFFTSYKGSGANYNMKFYVPTYTAYATTCCTPLGSINGSVSWNNPTQAVLTWDNVSHVASWTVKWKTGAGSYATTNVSAITTNGAGKKTCTVSSLSCNTDYDFIIIATPDDGYCDASEELTNKNSGKWAITLTDAGEPTGGLFAVTDGDVDVTGGCEDDVLYLAAVAADGYQFDNWEITYTSGGADAWDDVEDTGDATDDEIIINMPAADITVNAVYSCIPTTATVDATSVAGNYGWRYTPGETIDLTCTVSGATPTGYQWQKYVGSVWTDINKATNASAGTARLQIASCASSDGGSYRCVVTTGTGCSFVSDGGDGYFVRIFTLDGNYSGSAWTKNAITWTGEKTGTVTLSLNESSIYMFKVTDNDGKWFGNGTNNYIIQPVNWNCYTGNSDMRLFTGPEGNYTFTLDITNAGAGSPYVNVQVAYPSVTHPVEGYAYVSKWWTCYPHFWDGSGNALTPDGYDPELTTYTTICNSPYWYFPVLATYVNVIVKDNATYDSAGNKSDNQTTTNHSGMYLTHDGSWGWHDFETYTISFAGNGNSGGSMSDVSNICPGANRALAENGYTKTGYHFDGWKTNVAVTINTGGDDTNIAANGIVPDEATIKSIGSNITLTAQWAPNTNTSYTVKHYKQNLAGDGYDLADTDNLTGTTATSVTPDRKSYEGFTAPSGQTVTILADGSREVTYQYSRNSYTLTWALSGGTVTTAGTCAAVDATGSPSGSVKYGASITAPIVQKTGYNMTWSSSPAATMPAANTTYTANWTANTYLVTLKKNGGSGDDQEVRATYDADMPLVTTADGTPAITVHTRNGYTLLGYWDATSDGNQYYSYGGTPTPSLSSFRTWNKTAATDLYARWQANQYTVTLDANGGVDGATTSVTTTFGAAMPTIDAEDLPTREGYRFDGFYTEKSSGTKYYNADGTSAKNQARYSNNQVLYAHWVAQLTFSVNGAIDGTLTRDDNTAMPSSAAVPTACGDCWVFAGWSTDSDEDEEAEYAGGATHEFGAPQTLYAVYGKVEYQWVKDLSDLVNNEYYILTMLDDEDNERALANSVTNTKYATATDISSNLKENSSGYFIYNPDPSIVWKFTGTTSSGRLYNESACKYLDLSSTSNAVLQASTSDNLNFTKFNSTLFNIASTSQTSHYLYMYTNPFWGVDNDHDGYASCYIYKRLTPVVSTTPSCETYDIVWKVDGTPLASGSQTEETNACAGIEELPTDPDDDALDCATKFVGWSEQELVGVGHDAPADLFTSVGDAPAIDEDKTFHAVFATTIGTPIAAIEDTEFSSSDESGSYCKATFSFKAADEYLQKQSIWTSSNMTNVKVRIRVYHVSNNTSDVLRVSLINSSGVEVVGADLTTNNTGSDITSAGGYSSYVELTPTTAVTGYKVSMKTKNSFGTGINKIEREVVASSFKDYVTMCCDYIVTLSDGSPSNGSVTFDPVGPIETCTNAKEVSMTITPDPGYYLSAWTSSGVAPSSVEPAVITNTANAQTTTVTFAKETTEGTYTAGATFSAKALEGWTWMYKKDADIADGSVDPYDIPDVVEIYKDQYARFIITGYTPADVIAAKQGYVYSAGGVEPSYSTTYLTWVANTATYFTLKGKAPVESTTITFKAVGDASITKTVTIKVKALPLAHFVDNVHNESFADVVATVSTGVVTLTKQTPTHADFTGSALNTCEETHLHLVGWIDGDWTPYAAYMAGTGDKPTISAITGATGYFYAPGADIDLVAKDGKTYYAVWAKVQ